MDGWMDGSMARPPKVSSTSILALDDKNVVMVISLAALADQISSQGNQTDLNCLSFSLGEAKNNV